MAALGTIVLSFALTDERTLRLLLTSLCLMAALLVAAIVVAWVNRWRRQRDGEDDLSPNAQLAQFRSLYEKGAISQEEFERLRALLSARMRESLQLPAQEKKEPSGSTTGGTPVPPAPPTPPENGIQRPDGPESGIRPA